MSLRSIPLCIVVSVLFAALAAGGVQADAPVVGGWSPAEVTRPEVAAATRFAVDEETKVIRAGKKGVRVRVSLMAILSAEEQVVAGMNYRLNLKVKVNGQIKAAEAVVWWQAWNKKAPYRLTAWRWKELARRSDEPDKGRA